MANSAITLNGWMRQQPVSILATIRACCSPTKARRRYARMALFKRFTIEELERRYQKEEARLSHKENQLIRQVIKAFKRGWYISVEMKHLMGTFYSPWSPLFSVLLLFAIPFISQPLSCLLPCTTTIIASFKRKDNHYICGAYVMVSLFPLFIAMDTLCFLLFIPIMLLFVLIFALLVEPFVFLVGMCWYGCRRMDSLGTFVYTCKVLLVMAEGSASATYYVSSKETVTNTVRLTKYDEGGELMLPHASLHRTICNNPVVNIFKDLHWSYYSYGELADYLLLSDQEARMYQQRRNECQALKDQAELMV